MGNARRRFFSGPGIENFDATLSRSFLVTDNRALEFRAEAFNLFNHAQFFGALLSKATSPAAVSARPSAQCLHA